MPPRGASYRSWSFGLPETTRLTGLSRNTSHKTSRPGLQAHNCDQTSGNCSRSLPLAGAVLLPSVTIGVRARSLNDPFLTSLPEDFDGTRMRQTREESGFERWAASQALFRGIGRVEKHVPRAPTPDVRRLEWVGLEEGG